MIKKFLDYLGKVKFAITILIILAVASVFGTLIEQNLPFEAYQERFGFLSHGLYFFGLTHLYQSVWFIFLLFILGLSLFSCSLRRWKILKTSKANTQKWGLFLTHLSILVIFLGAVFGHYFGFSYQKNITEGKDFTETHSNLRLKVNNFEVKYNEKHFPLNYSSDVDLFENDKFIISKKIEVNHPLKYKGINFYQSSFGISNVALSLNSSKKSVKNLNLHIMEDNQICSDYTLFPMNDHGETLFFQHFLPDLAFNNFNEPYNFSNVPANPGLYVFYNPNYKNNPHNWVPMGWVTKTKPILINNRELSLVGLTEFTGLSVKKDPGVPIVWLGFFLLTAGIWLTLASAKLMKLEVENET